MSSYRGSADPDKPTVIQYGPLPRQTGWIAALALTALACVVGIVVGLDYGKLSCGPATCSWRPSQWLGEEVSLRRQDVRGIEVERLAGNDYANSNVKLLAVGRQPVWLARVPDSKAQHFKKIVETALRKGTPTGARLKRSGGLALGSAGGLVGALLTLLIMLLRGGWLELRVGARTLTAQRRALGLRWGRRELPLDDVVAIITDRIDPKLKREDAPPDGTRLILVHGDGRRTPLSEAYFGGGECHERARSELTAALRLLPAAQNEAVAPDTVSGDEPSDASS